ncbi:hypothetical protein DYB30_013539, partial [Aphanomyces astaci]
TSQVPVLLDSGSGCAAITSRGLATPLSKRSGGGEMLTASMPQPMEGFGQVSMLLTLYMLVNKIVLGMVDGPSTLLQVSAWIDETDDGANITLGRKMMETVGYDLEGDEDDNTAAYAPDADHDVVVKELLLDAVRAAQVNGLSEAGTREVHSLVMAAIDVFRVSPRNEPPVDIEPLKVVLQQVALADLCLAQALMQLVTLAHPNEHFDFYLCTDASHEFHGAVLTQPRYLADKLARWSVALTCFRYDIRHVPSDKGRHALMLG